MGFRQVIECDYCSEQEDSQTKLTNTGKIQEIPDGWFRVTIKVTAKDGQVISDDNGVICGRHLDSLRQVIPSIMED